MPAAMDLMAMPGANKRRRYSTPPTEYSRAQSRDRMQIATYERPPTAPKTYNREFRHLLDHVRIPKPVLRRLEHAFDELQSQNADFTDEIEALRGEESAKMMGRGRKIQEHEARLRCMKVEMGDQDREIARLVRGNQELRERVEGHEEMMLLQDELMRAAAKGIEQKRLLGERLEKENMGLQNLLGAKEARIAGQNELIMQMQNASGDAMTGLALEAQAQRTLGMIQGLRAEIAERDGVIVTLSAEMVRLQEQVENQELKETEQLKALEAMEGAVNAAKQRAAEAQRITEDQGKLIKRLMEVNASLQPGPG